MGIIVGAIVGTHVPLKSDHPPKERNCCGEKNMGYEFC